MKPWQNMPQQQQQVQIHVDKKDIIVCPCGGLGLLYNAAFLPKHNPLAIGQKPQIAVVPIIVCNSCGEQIEEPFLRAGDIKEAS